MIGWQPTDSVYTWNHAFSYGANTISDNYM